MNRINLHGTIPITLNPDRAIEFPVGRNEQIIRYKVDKIHVATSVLDVARQVVKPVVARMRKNKAFTPELRRGLVAEVIRCHAENRELFYSVMRGF